MYGSRNLRLDELGMLRALLDYVVAMSNGTCEGKVASSRPRTEHEVNGIGP